jgi:hypothetical protein
VTILGGGGSRRVLLRRVAPVAAQTSQDGVACGRADRFSKVSGPPHTSQIPPDGSGSMAS